MIFAMKESDVVPNKMTTDLVEVKQAPLTEGCS